MVAPNHGGFHARAERGERPMTSAAAAAAIEIEGLCTRYGRTQILTDITLAVLEGETLGLIGLNGAGKTTLLKSILMLAAPSAGTVRLFGEPHQAPGSRARLAYLPERFQPPGHLAGHDFVRLTLAFYGQRAQRAIALTHPIRSYSKGMAQKLGLLATLLTDRPLLILDEPMSGLDPKARIRLKQQLVAYRDRGRTIFMSSHILADHDELCDRIAVLHRGRLTYVGSPGELKQRQGAATLEMAFLAEIEGPAQPRSRAPDGSGSAALLASVLPRAGP
jgi:ABC-2 type transport system ATP-binding protein